MGTEPTAVASSIYLKYNYSNIRKHVYRYETLDADDIKAIMNGDKVKMDKRKENPNPVNPTNPANPATPLLPHAVPA